MSVITRPRHSGRFVWLSLAALLLAGCAEDSTTDDPEVGDEGVEEAFFDEDYGKPMLGEVEAPGKEDSANGRAGLPASVDDADAVVWEVRNQWTDTDTDEARRAGIAWPADSGLTWDEKYAAWIESMPRIEGHSGWYDTFELTTPWGKTVPAPSLECAETSIFLRVAFASWYGLPFYMEAVNGRDGRLYFGHFGALTSSGQRYNNTPNYKTRYEDFSHLNAEEALRDWPSDSRLRSRSIYGTSADDQPFLGPDAEAGAYFDEVFLNKRVGHFLVLLLSYFGSINLADSNNTFNLVPSAIQPGDTLLERWQRRGIGHTLVLKHVERLESGGLEAELVSGSMPRRQPKWEDAPTSKRSFTLAETGGVGTNSDGQAYWRLGGGIKRWRIAQVINGRYRNVVLPEYRDLWIPNWDQEGIQARPAQFEELLGEVSPEQKREVILQTIEDKRQHLRQYPASCSARIGREEAFAELYTINQEQFGMTPAETDAEFRTLEDYVFAELEYQQSKTCCWNSTTAAMYEIIMDLNRTRVLDESTGTCNEPVVFMNRDGGYDVFRDHAVSLDRGDEWVPWSEDEPCAQRDVVDDTEAPHAWAPFCDVRDAVLDVTPSDPGCADAFSANDSRATAAPVDAGSYGALAVCEETSDWYRIEVPAGGTLDVLVEFSHADGDIDLGVYDDAGTQLDNSASIEDRESVSAVNDSGATASLFVEVFGFQGVSNSYDMTLTVR